MLLCLSNKQTIKVYRMHNGKIYSLPALPSFLLSPRDKCCERSVIFFFRLLAFFLYTDLCVHTHADFLFVLFLTPV